MCWNTAMWDEEMNLSICIEPKNQCLYSHAAPSSSKYVLSPVTRTGSLSLSLRKPFIFIGGSWALAAAHGKDAHAVEVIDLTAHEMIEVAGDMMDFSAIEFRDLVAPESFEILVRAVDKADIVFELAYLFEQLLLVLRAVPDKSEIAADEERVALFQFFERGRCESLVISVGVSRNIKHDF